MKRIKLIHPVADPKGTASPQTEIRVDDSLTCQEGDRGIVVSGTKRVFIPWANVRCVDEPVQVKARDKEDGRRLTA